MKLQQSENGHLWYAIDEEGKICYVSVSIGVVIDYISKGVRS